MLNMRIFGKHCKNRFSVGGSAPEPPLASALLHPPIITTLSGLFLALNAVSLPSKKNKITQANVLLFGSSALLSLFFASSSAVFVDGGCKNISCSRAQGPSYATGNQLSFLLFYECRSKFWFLRNASKFWPKLVRTIFSLNLVLTCIN